MDTVIFALIFLTLLAACSGRRKLTAALFLSALAGALLLFYAHVTDPLPLNF